MLHDRYKPASQFMDALRLTQPDGLMWDQRPAYPQGRGSGGNKFRGCFLIDSPGPLSARM